MMSNGRKGLAGGSNCVDEAESTDKRESTGNPSGGRRRGGGGGVEAAGSQLERRGRLGPGGNEASWMASFEMGEKVRWELEAGIGIEGRD